jgi:hypothetical protein
VTKNSSNRQIVQKRNKGFMALVPVVFGLVILLWGIMYLGYEQSISKEITDIENIKNVQVLVAQKSASMRADLIEKYEKLGMSRAAAKAKADVEVTKFVQDIMKKNNI